MASAFIVTKATPCKAKTMATVRSLLVLLLLLLLLSLPGEEEEEAFEDIAAARGYTPPAPTPKKNRATASFQ